MFHTYYPGQSKILFIDDEKYLFEIVGTGSYFTHTKSGWNIGPTYDGRVHKLQDMRDKYLVTDISDFLRDVSESRLKTLDILGKPLMHRPRDDGPEAVGVRQPLNKPRNPNKAWDLLTMP
jgi:hypothetical protein